MKTPLLSFPLLLINGLWLGLIVGLVVSPLVLCTTHSRLLENYTFSICLLLILLGLYQFKIKQTYLLIFNIIAGILTFCLTKIMTANDFSNLLSFIINRCTNLYPSGKNDIFGMFVLSLIYMGFLLVQYGLRLIVLKIK